MPRDGRTVAGKLAAPHWPISEVRAMRLGPGGFMRILAHVENEHHIVQGVDVDIVAQGMTFQDALERFWRCLAGAIAVDVQEGNVPLQSCDRVPKWVKERFRQEEGHPS